MTTKGTVREVGIKKYYADRGLAQYSVVTRTEEKERLRELTKNFGLSQADVMQAIFECAAPNINLRLEQMALAVAKKAENQVSLASQLKKATPGQLLQIQKLLAGGE